MVLHFLARVRLRGLVVNLKLIENKKVALDYPKTPY
jgi:hypothetical protein